MNAPELLAVGAGAAEQRLRPLFQTARENRPAIVFLDEVDMIAGRRDSLAAALQGSIVQLLLAQLDGMDALSGVVAIAATNRPRQLDPALLRPGRFDRPIYVPLPDEASRIAQWKLRLAGKPGADRIDYAALAFASEGYTGAEIRHVANEVALAKLKAAVRGDGAASDLTTDDVLGALCRLVRPRCSHDVGWSILLRHRASDPPLHVVGS